MAQLSSLPILVTLLPVGDGSGRQDMPSDLDRLKRGPNTVERRERREGCMGVEKHFPICSSSSSSISSSSSSTSSLYNSTSKISSFVIIAAILAAINTQPPC